MPALAARLRREGGSLITQAASVSGVGGSQAASPGPDEPAKPVFVSLPGGLARLALELGRSDRFAVRTSVTVRAIRRTADGFALDCGPVPASNEILADAVILAVPAAKAATLLASILPVAATELAGVPSASMAIVTLAYRDAGSGALVLPPGSGLLVGSREGFAVKAVTLSSQKWPGTPEGLSLLRASVGRAGQTRDLQSSDSDLIALVRRDLIRLLGIRSEPIDSLVTRWGGALPQYAVGHVDRVARVRESVATVPGLAVCGATYDGIGIPACIASATKAVEQIELTLRPKI
jgi:oxygen-dependent protoporphyrinogen oxidase